MIHGHPFIEELCSSVLSHYIPEIIDFGRETGGFVCSVTIVNLAKGLLSLPDTLLKKFKRHQ